MRNDFRLHPAPTRWAHQKKSPLRRSLPVISILTICVLAIYVAISRTDTTAVADITAPGQSRLSLAIPGAGNDSPPKGPIIEQQETPVAPVIASLTPEPVTTTSGNISLSLPLPEAKTAAEETAITDQSDQNSEKWLEEKVMSGDSLSLIFSRLEISAKLLHQITHSSKEAEGLTNIKPGESVRVKLGNDGRLQELIYQPNAIETLHITPDGDGFKAESHTKKVEKRLGYLSDSIVSSFYLSAQKAGLSDALIMDLATIFGWDIDFALEIRKGDSFTVVYEEEFLNGNRFGNGKIIAAEFINRGEVYRAIRYEKDDGEYDYYSPDGKSMRKAFLRAPVDFRRISSRFAKERFHPVLGKKRPHRGVDYAAAIGTPIKAAGDGKVIFRGVKGGYGRVVIIKHGSQYSTLYGHMSRFNSSVRSGSRVRQGQTIGYVGKSGLATGPHLHYEFRINGVHRNPLTVKLPASKPLESKYISDFLGKSSHLTTTMDLLKRSKLAQTTTK
jgi:murein DD-endopeptidase MepM/ murein hydrolase activator NlpD